MSGLKGRPCKYDVKLIKKAFTIESDIVEWLKTKPNMSEFVNTTLKKERDNEPKTTDTNTAE